MTLPKPATSSKSHPSFPILSCLLIIVLLLLPSRTINTLQHPSIFTARLPKHAYKQSHGHTFPFARVCSQPAKTHFLQRLTNPTRPLFKHSYNNITKSHNRVLLSTIPYQVGDGLGHRTCILNYEHHLAKLLDITYTHRVSSYGSLTKTDPQAVESLFNWGMNETPREEILSKGCAEIGYINDTCEIPNPNIVCKRVKPRSKGGLFDQSVIIPSSVTTCLLEQDKLLEHDCSALVRTFTAAYPEPNTLFQMYPDRCFREWLYTNFTSSRDWFRHKYWNGVTRVDMDVARIQLAMHVRRGDFFNYTNRILVSDNTFADVFWRVKHALDDIIGGDVPIDVHVYSEGLSKGRMKDVHDTTMMEKLYIDDQGIVRGDEHWDELIRRHRRAGRGEFNVITHFAEDTLRSVREMIAADVFVGSISGLSTQVVRVFGRGVMVLPIWEGEVGDELVVPFDWGRNGFDSFLNEDVLYAALAEVVRRNRLACSVW